MDQNVFHSGPPPHIGWWSCDSGWWRWWNGERWSHGVKPRAMPYTVRRGARKPVPLHNNQAIGWSHYWPENARVPRLDPTGGHWTFRTSCMQLPTSLRTAEVRLRDGREMVVDVWLVSWADRGLPGDIVAWRAAR